MKNNHQIIFLFILGMITIIQSTYGQLPATMNVNSKVTGTVLDQATQQITLSPGFFYSAQNANSFIAQNYGYRGFSETTNANTDQDDKAIPYADQTYEKTNDSLKDQTIRIFPNPTKGNLEIDLIGYPQRLNSYILIFNVIGNLIIKTTIVSSTMVIDLSVYPDGIYIFQIVQNDTVSAFKIIKG